LCAATLAAATTSHSAAEHQARSVPSLFRQTVSRGGKRWELVRRVCAGQTGFTEHSRR
jgi:hypothetical protein